MAHGRAWRMGVHERRELARLRSEGVYMGIVSVEQAVTPPGHARLYHDSQDQAMRAAYTTQDVQCTSIVRIVKEAHTPQSCTSSVSHPNYSVFFAQIINCICAQ